jgi:hypothetical protein
VLVLDKIEILPPLGKYKDDTRRILPVKCYIDNSVRFQSCIRNINIETNKRYGNSSIYSFIYSTIFIMEIHLFNYIHSSIFIIKIHLFKHIHSTIFIHLYSLWKFIYSTIHYGNSFIYIYYMEIRLYSSILNQFHNISDLF